MQMGLLKVWRHGGSVAVVLTEFAAENFDQAYVIGELHAGPARLRAV